jgi:TetR/AcrR family transcriptional regulator
MNKAVNRIERKEWAAEQRRDRIVEKAMALFNKSDIDKILMEEIAKASGYTVQNLYSYFRDKEDIFAAVLLNGLITMLSACKKAYDANGTGIEKILAIGEQFFIFSLRNPKYFDLNLRFEKKYYAYHKKPPRGHQGDFIAKCQKMIDEMSDLLIEAIKIGIADGSIKTSLDPKHLMLFLWAQIIGAVQVIIMRQKYFTDIYKLTTDTFLEEFRSFIRGYLSQTKS